MANQIMHLYVIAVCEYIFYFSVDNCPGCKSVMEQPKVLPCSHRMCRNCLIEAKNTDNMMCAKCQKPFKAEELQAVKQDKYVWMRFELFFIYYK